ncbi:NDxxF motif lipoprotein [Mammaliicoccus lentus]|uniref:NDxxF motif lipoprotein n=1 Tax=Mammaliicoccus lentus TaxID=42858 RepID=UPI0011C88916|nr:NDxxF motif lipoprotein [Mammaliicoccus lentus]
MKKNTLLFMIIIILIVSYGCSKNHEAESDDNEKLKPPENIYGIKNIFEDKVTNKVVSEQDMKKDIQLYLDSFAELSEVIEYYQDKIYDEKLNQKDEKNLKRINTLIQENDENFHHYIENNELPNKYKENVFKIYKYIHTYNQFNIDPFLDDIQNGKISKKNVDKLQKDTKILNGREQKKIENFLKEQNIKTKAFRRGDN